MPTSFKRKEEEYCWWKPFHWANGLDALVDPVLGIDYEVPMTMTLELHVEGLVRLSGRISICNDDNLPFKDV